MKRYRTEYRLFRSPLIVLQVGEHDFANHDPSDPRDLGQAAQPFIRWRDATPEDLINSPPPNGRGALGE